MTVPLICYLVPLRHATFSRPLPFCIILIQKKTFIVEVDASETGVGAVLSQRFDNKPKMFPVAFFSRKLSPAERNYNVEKWELLGIKLVLEEWRLWLEGQFEVFTDHKNLEYLQPND